MTQKAFETAFGMLRYRGSNAEREDRAELAQMERISVAAHNACHDWLVAHPNEHHAPADMASALKVAEARVARKKQYIADQIFEDDNG